ncbi:hypothetical protein [Methylibium rhizosphaerae]|uniref:hypothetical protein n=1 Tax=Methylibium rhizosphaerae TaxID=2570323 RepID=UPI00112DD8AF|nr:hypothetical protein [Methylibium rhizosphaerae]
MSSIQAPAWAFTAEAIDGVGDTHLPAGVHVRALPSPQLGIPATPLAVYRSVLTPDHVKRLALSGGVIWVDSQGQHLTEPFQVTPDNPVYGYFPRPDVIWAELNAVPAILPNTPSPLIPIHEITPTAGRLTPRLTVPVSRMVATAAASTAATTTPALSTATASPSATVTSATIATPVNPGGIASAAAGKPAPLRFEALTSTAQGPAAFQSRSKAPYVLAAWTIPMVRVVGQGTVNGIRWLAFERAKEFQRDELWEVWSLPIDTPTPRYVPTANARMEAKDRVNRAAVLKQPMYVAYGATGPAAAPSATGADALARVGQVDGELQRWLDILLNDMSAPTWELQDTHGITGQAKSNVSIPIEPFMLAGAVDPDVGHHLAFGDVDSKVPAADGSLVLYRVRGLWRWTPQRWNIFQRPAFSAAVRAKPEDAVQFFPELKQFDIVPTEEGPFVDLHTMAVAMRGTPPDVPGSVNWITTEDRGWLAAPPPPNVRRALRLLANGFVPHAVSALAAADGNGLRTLHPFPKVGRITIGKPLPSGTPLPVIVSRPVDATGPGEGRFEDRDAPAGAVDYQLAQGDWFGRWSGWTHRTAPAKARTVPMKPTIELYPQPPTVPSPVPNGLLHGTIEVRIPIPRTPDLPAGGSALMRLDLDETFAGLATTTTSYTLGSLAGATLELHPAPAHDILVIHRNGPDLPRCGSKKVTYTARWIDVLNLVSPNADPASRTIMDPRPPEAPPVITELRYTARPDVQGHARVDLDFGSTVGTRYRVFASNETILLKALQNDGHVAARNDILSAAPGAPRAMKFKQYKALFGWDHFENLTKQPIEATSSTTRFVHRVSGSLDVLTIYRVLGEGPTGVLSEITESELVPFAVPNLGAPARPQIAVVNAGLDPTTSGVKLRVKVPRAKAAPKAWRLRRASVPVSDPLRMDLVAHGSVSSPIVERDGTSFDITVSEPLKAWRHYRFAVEVQADDPPGAPTVGVVLPGEWSEASATAQLAVIPPDEPAAATSVSVANVAEGLKVTMHHPAAISLISTALGDHRFETWRVEPGKRPTLRELLFIRGAGDVWEAVDPGVVAPPGTYVTVSVIDPIGRRSEARPSNQI